MPVHLRIYVMHPPEPGAEWAVRVADHRPVRFRHERDALTYALSQARINDAAGMEVELRVEDDHGHWRAVAL
ncbi:hypothetical protein EC912_10119 [Luteibacter rhizovicinus]|uniref:Uncharacterized protein n=1 Tax=Luteibacter rhizovicinus TaxID=242606 RepID=A0A4R3YWX3_9GAMM|nr:hypothetical protein [Luteibacter rhizovicinus]TCV97026.1 hypothetical protein EC912_10119 [Luteibacter rhizovicinus]